MLDQEDSNLDSSREQQLSSTAKQVTANSFFLTNSTKKKMKTYPLLFKIKTQLKDYGVLNV